MVHEKGSAHINIVVSYEDEILEQNVTIMEDEAKHPDFRNVLHEAAMAAVKSILKHYDK